MVVTRLITLPLEVFYALTDSSTVQRASREDVVNFMSVCGCEIVHVYVPRGLRGLIHLLMSLSGRRVCARQQAGRGEGKINKNLT